MFVNEVSRKSFACMILLIADFFLFLYVLNIRFSKLFLEIVVPSIFVLSAFLSEWVGKKYWHNQRLVDILSKAFFVLFALMVLLVIMCVRSGMKN